MSRFRPLRMLVTDLDGTLLGDDAAAREFAAAWSRHLASRCVLVYSSGRFPWSMRASIEQAGLPAPDWYVGGVGTEIEAGDGRALREWSEVLAPGWSRDAALAALAARREVSLQPDDCQGPFKVSGFWTEATPEQLAELERDLGAREVRGRVIYSSRRDLDLLPAAAGKGRSARFLAEHLGIPPAEVVCCGDSGNDADLFLAGLGAGILVGNADAELCAAAPLAYRARARCAGGIVEGLRELGFLPEERRP